MLSQTVSRHFKHMNSQQPDILAHVASPRGWPIPDDSTTGLRQDHDVGTTVAEPHTELPGDSPRGPRQTANRNSSISRTETTKASPPS